VKAEAATLARHRLQRAREPLHERDLRREANAQDGAVDRCYNASFRSAVSTVLMALASTAP